MEFDIGNILYIVITLVAVIVGLLGRKKKPAEDGSGAAGGGFMENLERMLNMGQEEQQVMQLSENEEDLEPEVTEYEPVTAQTPVVEETRVPNQYEEYLERLRSREADILLSESDAITEPLEVLHLDEEEGTDYFEVVEDFNAATAVVYSTIINRLDY